MAQHGGKKGLAWVSWDTLCKPIDFGGLGVNDIEKFNQVLLSKWMWRIMT